MEIYLLRHTTPDIELVHCYGQTDLDVAKTFADEAKRTKSILPDFEDVKIYCSPLIRCKKLAEYLQLGEIQFEERLKEFHFGDWELKRWKQINKRKYEFWVNDFVNRKTPNGESFKEMHDRVMEFFNEVLLKKDQNIIMVCHGGVIRAILANILHMPLKYMFRMNVDFGSVSKVTFNDDILKADFINR